MKSKLTLKKHFTSGRSGRADELMKSRKFKRFGKKTSGKKTFGRLKDALKALKTLAMGEEYWKAQKLLFFNRRKSKFVFTYNKTYNMIVWIKKNGEWASRFEDVKNVI